MIRLLKVAYVFAVLMMGATAPVVGQDIYIQAPEPNPPAFYRYLPEAPAAATAESFRAPSPIPSVEWTYHKTPDNLHPDGNEQQMVWLMNRARSNPPQEGIWLAWLGSGGDTLITRACNNPPYWVVDIGVLQNAFAAIQAKPPAAFDVRLYYAAKDHSDYLISINAQSHTGQTVRVHDAGFEWGSYIAGVVFSYSLNAVYGHAGFNIDWGDGPYGMQDPPGHRNALMSVTGNYTNVGYAVVPETSSTTTVGPQVITGNLADADTGNPDHFNRFIVGTVWEDTNSNGQYDPGEGLAGVTVMPDSGTYYAVTGNSGGYAVPADAGTYTVSFSGGEIVGAYTRSVAVGTSSVLQDLEYFAASGSPPSSGGSGGGGGGGGGGCFLLAAGAGAHPAGLLTALLAAAGVIAALRGTGMKAH
jgi:hypothetical protein